MDSGTIRGETMNRLSYVISFLFAVSTLFSCAHETNSTAEEVAANTLIERQEYQPGPWVSGPKVGNRYEGEYHLRGYLSGRTISFYELVFLKSREALRGEAFFFKSFDEEGNELPVIVIRRQAWPYETFTEVVGVRLTREALIKATGDGLTVKIVGRRDKPVVKVPAFYVTGFLNKVDTVTKEPKRPRS